MPISSYVLIAFSEPWRADRLCQLVQALRPGMKVVQVNDGLRALKACQRQAPLLLVADGELNGLDGPGLLRQLRRHGPTQRLACILISDRTSAEHIRTVLPLAPTAYLAKPVDLDNLRQRLDSLLPRAGTPQATSAIPAGGLSEFLERMRKSARGAPMMQAVHEVLERCLKATEQNLTDLEAVFRRDPQITARLISQSNSAAQHQGAPCQTLSQALARLGVKRSLNLALETAVQRNARLQDERLAALALGFCEQAQHTADLAYWLARQMKLDAELCYTAGLLQNIGELALLRSLQDWLDSGQALAEEELQQALRERAAGFGSALRAQWRLPLGLRQVIAAYYSLGGGVFSREALVLNLTRLLLELPATESAMSLESERVVRLLRVDASVLQRVPRG
ncbi:HDOD domain-containing protein [Pseudomonas sp. ABC1]|uniref:HDOD domain-containing protein n=1 Tax=Pseudomonas sp. ABC1 TaxID=2748080 RepID=UPI0015C3B44F|nr:HDOD domain-containing protein [Pseudomonas sp. ABC1]QLF93662.1 HDOD domain-containing protein [Pseudomonas sp. ABC1]